MSAMLPLVESRVEAGKFLILSGAEALGKSVHPRLGAELTNTTGMKLPAGPITVYDGGIYAGDALIEFFSEGEKRLISYGEDLSVSASAEASSSRLISAVSISGGVMTISRKLVSERTYTLKNNNAETKKVIIEHPVTSGAALTEPAAPSEKTLAAYRFIQSVGPRGQLDFSVKEETILSERITLLPLRIESFVSYVSNQEIPANVREALQRAVDLKRQADKAKKDESDLGTRRDRLVSEQARIRQNLEAAGGASPQGQEYLRRLSAMDDSIDQINAQITEAEKATLAAQTAYEAYLGSLSL
jgi:hypothetical protein